MVKRRTWPRYRREEAQPPARREPRDAAAVTACPVCGGPLMVAWVVEEGPRGPRRVRLLRCPNEGCPRSRLGEGAE